MDKNTEIVGVSDALKQLATKKSPSPIDSLNNLQTATIADDGTAISDHKISINPSSSLDNDSTMERDDESAPSCGWWRFRPNYIQRFMNPKYALAFLCLAGAIQGRWPLTYNIKTMSMMNLENARVERFIYFRLD